MKKISMAKVKKWVDGKKTYIAAIIGVISTSSISLGVPIEVANVINAIAGVVAVLGRMDATRKIQEAFEAGAEVGKGFKRKI